MSPHKRKPFEERAQIEKEQFIAENPDWQNKKQTKRASSTTTKKAKTPSTPVSPPVTETMMTNEMPEMAIMEQPELLSPSTDKKRKKSASTPIPSIPTPNPKKKRKTEAKTPTRRPPTSRTKVPPTNTENNGLIKSLCSLNVELSKFSNALFCSDPTTIWPIEFIWTTGSDDDHLPLPQNAYPNHHAPETLHKEEIIDNFNDFNISHKEIYGVSSELVS
uniref:Uncharacterized protein n=1 Tax=Arcella intermedia TaxID=1963864 RepID=A0A6B2LE55_9EUKA